MTLHSKKSKPGRPILFPHKYKPIEVVIEKEEMDKLTKVNGLYAMGVIIERLRDSGVPMNSYFLYGGVTKGNLTQYSNRDGSIKFTWVNSDE